MPRGRHRHSPPLHRLLPPSAIAGVSLVCALGPWVFSEATVLRALAAAAAATAVVGAVVMRRWDTQAGKRVAELTRARAGDEWRYEERVAELESDLEESRELRAKLEQRLRAKRAELAGLRNEHAALLRRYATAETERASALEGRRLLELETAVPELETAPSSSPALPPAPARSGEPSAASGSAEPSGAGAEDGPTARAVFSPEGAQLYRQALTALVRFGRGAAAEPGAEAEADIAAEAEAEGGPAAEAEGEPVAVAEAVADAEPEGVVAELEEEGAGAGEPRTAGQPEYAGQPEFAESAADATEAPAEREALAEREVLADRESPADQAAPADRADAEAGPVAKGEDAAAAVTDGADASHAAEVAKPAGQPPAGHFTVPTAVAVVPPAPARRPVVEGGFDFFGTQKDAPKSALDSVQNEDLADVVGPEALAVHKAESEAAFKPAAARSPETGQVIDLTAHDETEQIDVQGLRSAAS
ncbi:hypothetical protein [Streptomyces sp. FBKL.4005]|uniref:hypothetical protein n=1 Tax=Streptomyces sp. FBKL.4005 TaxID=2015515 RepID=UPI001673B4F5|nr:hypothetical protein [Streptomyces sp. FBKL.4005]